jgi:hypothetical protein
MSNNAPTPSRNAQGSGKSELAGWDIGVAAFAMACMTAGFWRLWPGALMLEEAPIGPVILKAGLAALGFVGIATRWEDALRAYATNPTSLVFLGLVCVSPLWAVTGPDALRSAILMVTIWGFGVALALRFKPRELAEICGFAGLMGVIAQFIAHQTTPPAGAFDGDLAFACLATAWAAWVVPARRLVWLLGLGCCAALSVATGDVGALGAGIGLVLGLGLAKAGVVVRRGGPISIIVTAWVIVACIVGVTLFALFGAQAFTSSIVNFYGALGNQAMLGQGFASAGQSVSGAFGAGLGIVGLATALLVVFATLFQALLGKHDVSREAQALTGVWFAAVGAICVAPQEISSFGPVCIAFAASSFSIALACVKQRPKRVPLMVRSMIASNALPPRKQVTRTETPRPTALRPKI